MHEKTLPSGSLEILKKLEKEKDSSLEGWTLAGGTGLSLQIGHRISEDLDCFKTTPFELTDLRNAIKKAGEAGKYEILQEESHTLTIIINNVKMSFFHIQDPFIFNAVPYRFFSVADIRDIALMKLIAISHRGSRKDFIDLHTILRSGPKITEYFDLLPKKYGEGRANPYHILKSLTYFEDAEKEPMPRMLEPFNWEECKNFFIRQAHSIALPLS